MEQASAWDLIKWVRLELNFGRKFGAGFYDYPADGPKQQWPGLAEQFPLKVGADGTALLAFEKSSNV